MIHDSANNVEEGFAANLQEHYTKNTKSYNEEMWGVLRDGFGMECDSIFELLSKIE